MTINIQYHDSVNWVPCDDRTDEFINRAVAYRHRREQNGATREGVIEDLESGKTVRFGSDWCSEIRTERNRRPQRPLQCQERNGLGNAIDSEDY